MTVLNHSVQYLNNVLNIIDEPQHNIDTIFFGNREYKMVRKEGKTVWNHLDDTWECSVCGNAVGHEYVSYCETCGAKLHDVMVRDKNGTLLSRGDTVIVSRNKGPSVFGTIIQLYDDDTVQIKCVDETKDISYISFKGKDLIKSFDESLLADI